MILIAMLSLLRALRPDHVLKILELTDSFNIHREPVIVPLATEEKDSITALPDGHLRIIFLNNVPLSDLRGRLEKMDLSKVGKR
jgi:hypothetical protein